MPDVYAQITQADDATVGRLADAMELRAADPVQQAFVDAYMSDVKLEDARVIEIGCGTGAIARLIAPRPGVQRVLGIDPSAVLLDRARELAGPYANLSFECGDGRALPVDDTSFDVAVLHTVLSHVPDPDAVLREANRVLVPGGTLAVFDGDYSTITFAVDADDPLDACAREFRSSYIHDPWVMRRAVPMAAAAGFDQPRVNSHGYVRVDDAGYLLSVLTRGADSLAARAVIGTELADALTREGHRRLSQGTFFGHIAYVSVVATKP